MNTTQSTVCIHPGVFYVLNHSLLRHFEAHPASHPASPGEHSKSRGCVFPHRCHWHNYNANTQHSSGSRWLLTVVKCSDWMTKPTEPAGRAGNFIGCEVFRFKVSATPQVCTGSAEAKGSIHKAIPSTESQGCQAGRDHSGHRVQPPSSGRVIPGTGGIHAALECPSEGGSTSSLGNLFHCTVTGVILKTANPRSKINYI